MRLFTNDFSLLWASDRNTVYEEVRVLLQAGNAAGAYELLLQYEGDWSGEVRSYDYYLVSRLWTAVVFLSDFSLQRVVAAEPEFPVDAWS